MIRTKNTVSYDPVDLTKKETVYAKVSQAVRNDNNETYTLTINEWVEIPYTENVLNEETQEMELQNFISKRNVRTMQRTMTFVEADQLTAVVDQLFQPTETGSSLRKKYTILGHLIINNSENVRNVEWELV
jgi:tRNA G37 N-methylase Trm5